jgi:putative serine/threonine protein kinase
MLGETLNAKVGRFLCWPQYNEEKAQERLTQLEKLGVQAIAPGGPHRILGIPILGKGHSGIVIKALFGGIEVALKVKRTDTDRKSMTREAELIAHVNKWEVGPKLHGFSDDFILMELIEGQYFGEWVKENLENSEKVKKNLRALLDIAWRLDQSGLDHGELTRIKRHYIVTAEGPRVIDFESASLERAPRNLTSTVHSLFFNYRFAQIIGKIYKMPDREELLEALKKYKTEPIHENYGMIVKICNL